MRAMLLLAIILNFSFSANARFLGIGKKSESEIAAAAARKAAKDAAKANRKIINNDKDWADFKKGNAKEEEVILTKIGKLEDRQEETFRTIDSAEDGLVKAGARVETITTGDGDTSMSLSFSEVDAIDPEAVSKSLKQIKNARVKYRTLDGKIGEVAEDLDHNRAEFSRASKEYIQTKAVLSEAAAKAEAEAFQKQVVAAQAFQSIAELKVNSLNAEVRLQQLESLGDKALMGVYMREKIAKVLSSQAFCNAKKHSCDGGTTYKATKEDMDGIFSYDVKSQLPPPAGKPAKAAR